MKTIYVTCSTDDNYVQHCMAMLCSLFENNKTYEIIVYLLHHGLSNNSQKVLSRLSSRYNNVIKFCDIDASHFEGVELNPYHTWLSMATYYRFIIPSLIPPEVNRILYLDCDVIVLKDVFELYQLQMEDFGVAAIQDCTPFDVKHRNVMGLELDDRTFCAGVMMINVKYWRENNCQKKLFDYARAKKDKLRMEDQDVLNYVFRKKWFKLPYKWGKTPLAVAPVDKSQKWFDIKEYVNEPCIYHYAAFVKPWYDIWFPDRKFYWKYLKLSGYENVKETHLNRKARIRIYKVIIRYLINKYVRPFIPDIAEILLKDIYNILLFILNIFRPKRFKDLMLKRWGQKYGM